MITFEVMQDLQLVYEFGQWRLNTYSDERPLDDGEAEFIASRLLPSSEKAKFIALSMRGGVK